MANKAKITEYHDYTGFDVVCTIGRVQPQVESELSPYAAAFLLIGKHGAEGVYSFPGEHGEIIVDVTHRPPDSDPGFEQ